jgi:hypothetical protein
MREYTVPALFLLWTGAAAAQTPPAPPQGLPEGWTVLKDARNLCRIAVPPEWTALAETKGAAVFRDTATAIAVVTSQPGQGFKPMPASLLKVLEIRKDSVFENTAKRVFYQDKHSTGAERPNAFSVSVPGKDGTCSCHVTFLPEIPAEIARKIALTLGAAPE